MKQSPKELNVRPLKIFRLFLMMVLMAAAFVACRESDSSDPIEQKVSLEISSANLEVGDEAIVTPVFEPKVTATRDYNWTNSNSEVVDLAENEDFSAVITAKSEGTASLTFASTDDVVKVSVDITVTSTEDDGILKVLTIGNSFSEDAVEQYLYDLGKTAGVPMVIGNMYIGGATLKVHHDNAKSDATVYNYRKIGEDGAKISTANTSIATAVTDENWDFISFQQQSGRSGIYDTYVAYLPALFEYVQSRLTSPHTQFILHQTWAYASTSTHPDFPNYNNDQEQMYAATIDAVRKAQVLKDLDYVVPAGTAIQNGRNTFLGESFTRDGFHLSFGVGRYTAACTWFEALTGINVVGNSFAPDGLNATEVEIAQHAAHAAIADPDKVTQLTDYQNSTPEPLTAHVLVNFGHRTFAGWNTLGNHNEGASILNLKDEDDAFTGVSLRVTQSFNNINEVGESTVATDFEIPADVSGDSYFGNFRGDWGGLQIRQSQIKLSGLDKTQGYNLCFFSSRAEVTDNRETKFTVTGNSTATLLLNASNNTTEMACNSSIKPDLNGEIIITVTAGENNNNDFGFYYLNAMRVSPET